MESLFHIGHAPDSVEAVTTALLLVMRESYECHFDAKTTRAALASLKTSLDISHITISHCNFSGPMPPSKP